MQEHPKFETILREVPVFINATEEDISAITRLGVARMVEEGSYFFMQGDEADFLYILISGRAKLCTISADGQQVNLRTIVPNQLFGALGAVQKKAKYPAGAQALEDSSAIAIKSTEFHKLLLERPHLSFGLMDLMTGYIQEMQERYRELATERVEQRVARALLRLAAQSGEKIEQGGITLQFSQEDLSEMAGTTLYTVSRLLSQWGKNGILKTGRGKVTLIEPHGLVRIADDLVN
jgi:CRP/FNR family transcriptional regulator, nitrogen oxide reductase regulator